MAAAGMIIAATPRLILPVAPSLLVGKVIISLEGSDNGVDWFPVVRAVGFEGQKLNPANFPLDREPPKHFRQIVEQTWVHQSNYTFMPGEDRMRRLYKSLPA